MQKELFRYFLRKNYKNIDLTNEECDEIGEAFEHYLNQKCTPQQLKNFVPESPMEVIMNEDSPLKQNGFHPAFVLHFMDFVELQKEKK